MWEAFPGYIKELNADPSVRVIVLTGAGDKAFASGADISEFTSKRTGREAAGKTLIVVAAQVDGRRIGRIRLRRVPDASAKHLERAVQEAVAPGSVVRTDGLQGYRRLSERGYVHAVVREAAAVGNNLLPRVNRVVALFKRWLLRSSRRRSSCTPGCLSG